MQLFLGHTTVHLTKNVITYSTAGLFVMVTASTKMIGIIFCKNAQTLLTPGTPTFKKTTQS